MLRQENGLSGTNISSAYIDDDGGYWIGVEGKGLNRSEKDFFQSIDVSLSFTPTSILKVDSTVWVGTQSIGLLQLVGEKLVNHYTLDEGLQSNLITGLLYHNDQLFIATNNGLNVMHKNGQMDSYGKKEGFRGIEIKPNAVYLDDYLYFGTVEGLTELNPSLLQANLKEPITEITSFSVDLEPIEMHSSLRLQYDENAILIHFKGICITNAEKVRYQYMLEGIDKSWQPITDQDFANYPALPHGKYTFKVKAMNNNGIWNEEPSVYSFTIRPPFWLSWWFFALVGSTLIIGVVIFVKIRERQLEREKAILEAKVKERTVQIRIKNDELARKNKDITDSINYAKRIQKAMMPSVKKIEQVAPVSYVYYRPKDIVSGDFFWYAEQEGKQFVVAADCTGHGVPGAFMSMISISALNSIVNQQRITSPGEILNRLRLQIIKDLKQDGVDGDTKDGLDIALLAIDKHAGILEYAGAYNSLYVVDKSAENPISELKANRMPIGLSSRMGQDFETHRLSIAKGKAYFITTDGYIDQFGGEKGKKFMSRRFKQMLSLLPEKGKEESVKVLDQTFVEWMGNNPQLDDVLVIGLKF